jgi:hypothetical protein
VTSDGVGFPPDLPALVARRQTNYQPHVVVGTVVQMTLPA